MIRREIDIARNRHTMHIKKMERLFANIANLCTVVVVEVLLTVFVQ